jgi:hypothetical protein
MEFRLTYQGPLYATQRDAVGNQPSAKPEHKHAIRKEFHGQLKRLWEITPFLKTGQRSGPGTYLLEQGGDETPVYDQQTLSERHSLYGFNFVPLVTHELNLVCSLDILFLRPDKPGGVVWAGDIDNRLKTLFDSLRIPVAGERYDNRIPETDEQPFFCLLEEDSLITKVAVETDQLLQFVGQNRDMADVRLVITVRLRPYELHLGNMQFG